MVVHVVALIFSFLYKRKWKYTLSLVESCTKLIFDLVLFNLVFREREREILPLPRFGISSLLCFMYDSYNVLLLPRFVIASLVLLCVRKGPHSHYTLIDLKDSFCNKPYPLNVETAKKSHHNYHNQQLPSS